MKTIGIPKETDTHEERVSIVPETVENLKELSEKIFIQEGAGVQAGYPDEEYKNAGAQIVNESELYDSSGIIPRISPPEEEFLQKIDENTTVAGFLSPIENEELIEIYLEKNITAFSLELLPRISRAQNMDALSSMSTAAGYKAVLLAAEHFKRFFPLLMTAAGTVTPANVLVIGAGVAGLQAIATAKRLGAKVFAFDTRPDVKEQVESLGANFVEMELPEDIETEDGYAKEITEEFIQKEKEAIGERLPKTNILITTAQIFGKKAPLLITEEMVETMPNGSVIVDIAAPQGGNTELTEPGETVETENAVILGPRNLPSRLAYHTSQMFSKNILNLFKHIYKEEKLDFEDRITADCCISHNGETVSEVFKKFTQ